MFKTFGHRSPRGFTLIELLVVIAIIGILAGIVLVSLGTTRSRGNDAKTKEQLSGMRTAMESYYAGAGNYGTSAASDGCNVAPAVVPWNDSASGMLALADEDNYTVGAGGLVCVTSGTAWAAEAQLSAAGAGYFCVDSTGAATTTPASTISTTGPDAVCG